MLKLCTVAAVLRRFTAYTLLSIYAYTTDCCVDKQGCLSFSSEKLKFGASIASSTNFLIGFITSGSTHILATWGKTAFLTNHSWGWNKGLVFAALVFK